MKTYSALIVGCGDLGTRVGVTLHGRGWQVAGVRRDISRLPKGIAGYEANYTAPHSLDFMAAQQPDFILATFTPADRSLSGYESGFVLAMTNLLAGLGDHRPRHILAVSSTRVFAETAGGWVNEDSPLSTDDPRACILARAEQQLLDSGMSASVIRLAGLYGAPGGRLLSRVASGKLCSAQPVQYSNRIHRDDGAGFLAHLLLRAAAGESLGRVYIGVDDKPAPQYEVETWLAAQLGAGRQADSGLGDGDKPSVPAAAQHKRCRNKALHDSGYRLLYPCYQSGYRDVLAS